MQELRYLGGLEKTLADFASGVGSPRRTALPVRTPLTEERTTTMNLGVLLRELRWFRREGLA